MPDERALPLPWTLKELGESYCIEAANGVRFGYTYYEDEPVRRSLTKRVDKATAFKITSMVLEIPNHTRKR